MLKLKKKRRSAEEVDKDRLLDDIRSRVKVLDTRVSILERLAGVVQPNETTQHGPG